MPSKSKANAHAVLACSADGTFYTPVIIIINTHTHGLDHNPKEFAKHSSNIDRVQEMCVCVFMDSKRCNIFGVSK